MLRENDSFPAVTHVTGSRRVVQRLYESSSDHPGSVFYAFVFRYLLTRVLNSWYMPTGVPLSTQVAHPQITR